MAYSRLVKNYREKERKISTVFSESIYGAFTVSTRKSIWLKYSPAILGRMHNGQALRAS
jgi:hypothetical protein